MYIALKKNTCILLHQERIFFCSDVSNLEEKLLAQGCQMRQFKALARRQHLKIVLPSLKPSKTVEKGPYFLTKNRTLVIRIVISRLDLDGLAHEIP